MNHENEDRLVELRTPKYRRLLFALFCGGISAFMPLYSAQGLLLDIATDFRVSIGAVSWAVGAATLGVAIGAMPWAVLSNQLGRVRAMRWGISIGVVVALALPFAPTFEVMIATLVVEGLMLACVPAIAVTALAETVTVRALGTAVGTYIAGTTIGGLSGRIVSSLVADEFNWRVGMFFVGMLAALAALGFVLTMPPTVRRPVPVNVVRGVFVNLSNPGVLITVLQGFLLMGGFVATYSYLAIRLQLPPFNLTLAQVSWIFLAYLAGALVSRWVWSLVPRIPPTGAYLLCIAGLLFGLGLMFTTSLTAVVVGLVFFTGSFFGAHAMSSGLAPRRSKEAQNMATPLYTMGFYAGSSVLGWVGGVAFYEAGWAGTSLMIAIVIVLAAALAWGYALSQDGLRATDQR